LKTGQGDAGIMEHPPIVIIGNPENRRVGMFSQAARRLGLSAPKTIAYETALRQGLEVRQIEPHTLIRIESPGENQRVERGLMVLGATRVPDADVAHEFYANRTLEHGRIYNPRLWYYGFRTFLQSVQKDLEFHSVSWMNQPADILRMFDKGTCQADLRGQGVPVPRSLGTVRCYDQLCSRMRDAGESRVFLKLVHGSSASGVVALRRSSRRVLAVTSVEMVRGSAGLRLYNSLQLQRYRTEQQVAVLVDALGRFGLHAESWLPKAGCNGRTFDLRILVIAGQIRHVVMRTSDSPITNLHLGNRRGDIDGLLDRIPKHRLQAAYDSCLRAAALFSGSLYAGVDLMFTPGFRRHAVLEVNAFGDLLPGVLDRGQDTYTAEIAAAFPAVRGGQS
jgi:hypothetical protein